MIMHFKYLEQMTTNQPSKGVLQRHKTEAAWLRGREASPKPQRIQCDSLLQQISIKKRTSVLMDVRFFDIFKLSFYTTNFIFEFSDRWTDNKRNDYSFYSE